MAFFPSKRTRSILMWMLSTNPANEFVAGFIGSPRMNFVRGAEATSHGAHTIGIRPEHLAVSSQAGRWQGIVTVSEQLGSETFLHVDIPEIGHVTARTSGDQVFSHGDKAHLSPLEGRLYRFSETGAALPRPAVKTQ